MKTGAPSLPKLLTRCPGPARHWWCSRSLNHDGPCALRPMWYNLRARLRVRQG